MLNVLMKKSHIPIRYKDDIKLPITGNLSPLGDADLDGGFQSVPNSYAADKFNKTA